MKKILILLLCLCMTLFMLTACTDGLTKNNGSPSPAPTEQTDPSDLISPTEPSENEPEKEVIAKMFVTVNGNKLEVTLAQNSSVDALVKILKQGDITYTADDYGNFEKVGDIGHALPQNNTQITTQAGDVILYQGRNICLYYGKNSWNFTRIGRINGYSEFELRALLSAGNGKVSVTVSLI